MQPAGSGDQEDRPGPQAQPFPGTQAKRRPGARGLRRVDALPTAQRVTRNTVASIRGLRRWLTSPRVCWAGSWVGGSRGHRRGLAQAPHTEARGQEGTSLQGQVRTWHVLTGHLGLHSPPRGLPTSRGPRADLPFSQNCHLENQTLLPGGRKEGGTQPGLCPSWGRSKGVAEAAKAERK